MPPPWHLGLLVRDDMWLYVPFAFHPSHTPSPCLLPFFQSTWTVVVSQPPLAPPSPKATNVFGLASCLLVLLVVHLDVRGREKDRWGYGIRPCLRSTDVMVTGCEEDSTSVLAIVVSLEGVLQMPRAP